MIEKDQFRWGFKLQPTAASLGINRDDWFCYTPGDVKDNVKRVMLRERYDVVPIVERDGTMRKYFIYDAANQRLGTCSIKQSERLYYLTHARDLVYLMNKKKMRHFFLVNGKDEILGLVSLSNLNAREFYLYLFGLICYLEKELAGIIESGEEKAFQLLENVQSSGVRNQIRQIRARIQSDRQSENENDYREYLYFSHLVFLVKAEGTHKRLGYENAQEFMNGAEIIKDIRNSIAHPVKSLVRSLKDLDRLYLAMSKLYELKERLEAIPHGGTRS